MVPSQKLCISSTIVIISPRHSTIVRLGLLLVKALCLAGAGGFGDRAHASQHGDVMCRLLQPRVSDVGGLFRSWVSRSAAPASALDFGRVSGLFQGWDCPDLSLLPFPFGRLCCPSLFFKSRRPSLIWSMLRAIKAGPGLLRVYLCPKSFVALWWPVLEFGAAIGFLSSRLNLVALIVIDCCGFRIWDPSGYRIWIQDSGRTCFWNWQLISGIFVPVHYCSWCWGSCAWFWSSRVRLLCYTLGERTIIHTTTGNLLAIVTTNYAVYHFDDISYLVMFLFFFLSDVFMHLVIFIGFLIDALVHLCFVIFIFH